MSFWSVKLEALDPRRFARLNALAAPVRLQAHEVRNPLSVAITAANFMRASVPESARQDLNLISTSLASQTAWTRTPNNTRARVCEGLEITVFCIVA